MSSLVEQIGKPPKRESVIEDCVTLIDNQVKQKGFVIKSAYATIKAIKKRFVPEWSTRCSMIGSASCSRTTRSGRPPRRAPSRTTSSHAAPPAA